MASVEAVSSSAAPQQQSDIKMDDLQAAGALTGAAATTSLEPPMPAREQEQNTTAGAQQTDGAAESMSTPAAGPASSSTPQDNKNTLTQIPTATSTAGPSAPQRDPLTRAETEALGPATEAPIVPPGSGNAISITLMLTTGARHPYKIDEKYLRNRKVEVTDKDGVLDPRELSGYKLKELIWTDWRQEWEPRPAAPGSIRLIILGRFIEDKVALKDLPFKTSDTNVVHMTVKPADFIDDEEANPKGVGKRGSIRGRDDGEGGAGCRCVIL